MADARQTRHRSGLFTAWHESALRPGVKFSSFTTLLLCPGKTGDTALNAGTGPPVLSHR